MIVRQLANIYTYVRKAPLCADYRDVGKSRYTGIIEKILELYPWTGTILGEISKFELVSGAPWEV